MHIPDGFLDPKISAGLLGAAAGVVGYCAGQVLKAVTAVVPQKMLAAAGTGLGNIGMAGRRVLTGIGEEKIKQMGVVAAWGVAAQMFNFPISSGTSGHLIGGVVASVIIGPYAGTVVIAAILSIQSLFFADGGLMALGANIINMAVLGTFVSYYVYELIKARFSERAGIVVAAWFSVVLAACATSIEIGISGTIPLRTILSAMVPIHALIGIAEAVLTVLLLKLFNREGAVHE